MLTRKSVSSRATRHQHPAIRSSEPHEHQHVASGTNSLSLYYRPTNQSFVLRNAPETAAPASFSLSYGAPTSAFGDNVGIADRNRTSICREAELELEIDLTCRRHKPSVPWTTLKQQLSTPVIHHPSAISKHDLSST